MIEEKVIQSESVATSEQSVAVDDNNVQPTSTPAVDYQAKFEAAEAQMQAEKEARLKALDQKIISENTLLKQEMEDLRTSNERQGTKTSALSTISNLGAINAEQTLSLLQEKITKDDSGKVVILEGGIKQDLDLYIKKLKNPGSGWEHHFKPSTAAGMGAKPSPTSNAGGGQPNPWKTGNITQQMLISEQDPQLAAVLQREASQ